MPIKCKQINDELLRITKSFTKHLNTILKLNKTNITQWIMTLYWIEEGNEKNEKLRRSHEKITRKFLFFCHANQGLSFFFFK